MITSISNQVYYIIFSIIGGLLVGVLFDIYRLIRGVKTPNKILTIIQDILFWILAAFLVFTFLLYTNKAYIGEYVYIFVVFGVYTYMVLFSKSFIKHINNFFKNLIKIIRIIFNRIIYPISIIKHDLKKKKHKNY